MKLLRLTTLYPSYIRRFYSSHPALRNAGYTAQRVALDEDAFAWADFWSVALAPLGYDVWDVPYNVAPAQRAWAREHLGEAARGASLEEVAVRQAVRFGPEVLWFDDENTELLRRIRNEVPSIRVVLGYSGSTLTHGDVPRLVDLMISSAPEAVEYLRREGVRAERLRHGFDPRVGSRLSARAPFRGVTFVGQLVPGSRFHETRRRLLERLSSALPLEVFSPERGGSLEEILRGGARRVVGRVARAVQTTRVGGALVARQPLLRAAAAWDLEPVGPCLRRALRPAVYGLAMYQTLADSRVTLNIHADSSPRYASNMRLYEATGVGSCLLTDWKEGLDGIFDLDREVVAYRSMEECVEKARWLLARPDSCGEIGSRGKARVLKEHTFAHRAVELDAMIRRVLP